LNVFIIFAILFIILAWLKTIIMRRMWHDYVGEIFIIGKSYIKVFLILTTQRTRHMTRSHNACLRFLSTNILLLWPSRIEQTVYVWESRMLNGDVMRFHGTKRYGRHSC
jgi:hypothetical protein